MRTFSGREAPLSLEKPVVNLLDYIVPLGRERRFSNCGDGEWTILHHSMLAAMIWAALKYPPEGMYHILTHDFHEAYTRDIPTDVKLLINEKAGKPVMKEVEAVLDTQLLRYMGRGPPDAETNVRIKHVDKLALIIEMAFIQRMDSWRMYLDQTTEADLEHIFRNSGGFDTTVHLFNKDRP